MADDTLESFVTSELARQHTAHGGAGDSGWQRADEGTEEGAENNSDDVDEPAAHVDVSDVSQERAAQFLARALTESRRMGAEANRSLGKRDRVRGYVACLPFT
jgi:hypothetical protein